MIYYFYLNDGTKHILCGYSDAERFFEENTGKISATNFNYLARFILNEKGRASVV